MTQDRLIELLKGSGATHAGERSPECPDDGDIAAFIDGVLGAVAAQRLEAHLAECNRCRALTSAVLRVTAETETAEPISELLRARAGKLVGHATPRRSVWAAAATVLLALGLFTMDRGPLKDPAADSTAPTTRQSRLVEHPSILPKISLPAEQALVSASELAVRWSAVPGSRYYELRIVDDEGDLIWQERVADTNWKPKAELALTPGAEYFVRVDAYIDDAKPLSSAHVMFKVAPRG